MAPPLFFFGPLVGLLLVSRPASAREWVWVSVGIVWSVLWLQQSVGLGGQFTRAAAVLLTGMFLSLTLWRPSGRVTRSLSASGLAAVALAAWMGWLGLGWGTLSRSVGRELAAMQRAARAEWGPLAGSADMAQLSTIADTVSTLFPGLLVIAAVGGTRLAWAWYHRLAAHPAGAPPTPFPAFGFSDHLIWGWVAGVGLVLLPGQPARLIGANLLLVWGVLYASRGLAVSWAGAARTPAPVLAVLGLVGLVLMPFVLGGLTLLGLADTWLDFRRRLAPATGGYDR